MAAAVRALRVWLWDGASWLAEFDAANRRVSEYQYGGTDAPTGSVIGYYAPFSIRYPEQDALGNVMGTYEGTSSGLSVTQSVSYDAWGVPSYGGAMDSRLMWKGLMWEGDAVGLYYVRNRWYDPEVGRFIQEDPIGLAGGVNPYIFAENDPVNGADPTGLSGDCPTCEQLSLVWIREKADSPINWGLFWATLIEGISDGGGGGGWGDWGGGGGGGGSTAGPSQPNNARCQLVAPGGNYNVGSNAVALFQPAMANALTNAFNFLNSQGITPLINSGYRSAADQARMQNGGSGPNPAARVSWHQVGMAVDINGTRSSFFPTISSGMQAQGLTWGGTFSRRDLPHFQLPRAGRSPTAAMLSACGGGPR